MSYKDLAKDAVLIGVTQIIVNLASFILLPVITKTLGSDNYGIWWQVLVTIQLLSSIVLLGQNMTLLRFASVSKDREKLSALFFNVLYVVVLFGIATTLIMAVISEPLASVVFSDRSLSNLLVLAAPLVLFTALNGITSAFFRAVGKIKTYAALIIFKSLGEVFLIVAFILAGQGIAGAITGLLMVSIVSFTIGLALVIRMVGFSSLDKEMRRSNLRFGLPLTPNYIIEWVTTSSDRYIVAFILGLSMVGIYSAAYSIGGITFLFVAPIQLILYPTLSKLYDENRIDEVKDYIKRSFRYYLMLTVPAVIGISVLSVPLLSILTTTEFIAGALVVPLIALAGMFSGMFKFVENITHLVKKTHLNLIMFIIPAVLNVVLVVGLTPYFGIEGTALATAVSFAVMLLMGVLISRRFLKFSFDWLFTVKSLLASLLMAGALIVLDPFSIFDLVLTIVIGIFVYFGAMFAMKGFTPDEVELIKKYVHKGNEKLFHGREQHLGGRRGSN